MTTKIKAKAARSPGRKDSSELDGLLATASDLLFELRRMGERRKLTAETFVLSACQVAGCNENRLREIDKLMNDQPGADAARRFVRIVSAKFRELNWPTPPRFDQISKVCNAYGSEQADGQLGQLRITQAEAIALAALHCAENHPDAFGVVSDWQQHAKKEQAMRDKLQSLYGQMRDVVAMPDLTVDRDSVSPSERAKGMVVVRFRRSPNLHIGMDDWPAKLTESVLDLDTQLNDQEAAA